MATDLTGWGRRGRDGLQRCRVAVPVTDPEVGLRIRVERYVAIMLQTPDIAASQGGSAIHGTNALLLTQGGKSTHSCTSNFSGL